MIFEVNTPGLLRSLNRLAQGIGCFRDIAEAFDTFGDLD